MKAIRKYSDIFLRHIIPAFFALSIKSAAQFRFRRASHFLYFSIILFFPVIDFRCDIRLPVNPPGLICLIDVVADAGSVSIDFY
jgi:hypothetical protein